MQDFELLLQSKQIDSTHCGCYTRPHHRQNRHQKQQLIMVPLLSSDIKVEVVNSLANVTLVQYYKNPTDQILEMEYAFPADTKNCFYKFIANYGRTTIQGVVKEKQQAEREYQEELQNRKNKFEEQTCKQVNDSFMLNFGKIPPKEMVRVQVAFLQELSISGNKLYRLHLSKNIFPRYLDFMSIDKLKQGFRNFNNQKNKQFFWNFTVNLKTANRINFWDSNTHNMKLCEQNIKGTESQFTLKQANIINKDFIFTFSTQNISQPTFLLGRSKKAPGAMISFIPELQNKRDAQIIYQKMTQNKQILCDLDITKGQYVFLLDRSCSMTGKRIKLAKQAVILFLKSLPIDSYFNLISFGSQISKLFPESIKYTDDNINNAIEKIRNMEADLGGTYIYNIMEELLTQKKIQGYPRQIFLLTDGAVPNTEQMIRLVSRNSHYSRVHTIGFGNECSKQLILGCAKKGRGYYVFINDDEDPCQKIIQLLRKSITPVITDLRLHYDKSIVKSIVPNPDNMPIIYKNEIVNFYVLFKQNIPQICPFSITYNHPIDDITCKHEVIINKNTQQSCFVQKMIHFKRIKALQKTIYNKGNISNFLYSTQQINKKTQVMKESVQHQILSYFTAFVCLETSKDDNKGKAKGDIRLKVQISSLAKKLSSKALPPPVIDKSQRQFLEETATTQQLFHSGPRVVAVRTMPDLQTKLKQSNNEDNFGDFLFRTARQKDYEVKKQLLTSVQRHIQNEEEDDDDFIFAEDEDEQFEEKVSCELVNSIQFTSELKKSQKSQLWESSSGQNKIDFMQLVVFQSIEGSWKDSSIIRKLYDKTLQEKVLKQTDMIIVLTFLIVRWLEKHSYSRQYGLIIKKGLNYIKRNTEKSEEMQKRYSKWIS